VTYDFARLMEGATEVKCSQFAEAMGRRCKPAQPEKTPPRRVFFWLEQLSLAAGY